MGLLRVALPHRRQTHREPRRTDASLVALDAKTGRTVWKSPGGPPSYGSFLAARLGGRLQIVGHDSASLGGWDASTGQRLWQIPTGVSKEFGVPTPIVVGDRLLVCSENQGTRLYGFNPDGKIDPRPLAVNPDLAPDCHTPVVVGDRVFGVWSGLYCLDLKSGLKTRWHAEQDAFAGYAGIIASDNRLLVTSIDGDVVLAETAGDKLRIAGQWRVFPDDHGVYSPRRSSAAASICGVRRKSSASICSADEPDTAATARYPVSHDRTGHIRYRG